MSSLSQGAFSGATAILLGLSTLAVAGKHRSRVDDDVVRLVANSASGGDSTQSRSMRGRRKPSLATESERQNVARTFDEDEHAARARRWNANSSWEFEVVPGAPSFRIQELLRHRWDAQGLDSESYDSATGEWILSSGKAPATGPLAEAAIVAKGLEVTRRSLRGFGGQLQFRNTETQNVTLGGKQSVEFTRLRFSRLFHGGIVTGNASYAYLTMDGNGRPVEFRIKWPGLRPYRESQGTVSLGEALESLQSDLDTTTTVHALNDEMDRKKVLDSRVCGAALSWHPVETETGIQLLSPSYTFQVKMGLESGDSTSRVLDVPQQRRYWAK